MLGTSEAGDCLWDTKSVGLRKESKQGLRPPSKTKMLTKSTRITSLKNRQGGPAGKVPSAKLRY